MALPVLITVGALGAGFVVLSRSRANMKDASTGADGNPQDLPSNDAQQVQNALDGTNGAPQGSGGDAGNPTLSTGTGEGGVVIDPVHTDGGDPSTTGPQTTGVTLGGLAPPDDATPTGVNTISPHAIFHARYGASLKGVDQKQMSRTLLEFGPATGMVW